MHRIAVSLIALVGCAHSAKPTPPFVQNAAPVENAASDSDLHVMLAELASSRACGMIRDVFEGLRAPNHPDVVTGVLWLRQCESSNVGTRVTFHIKGNGWLWVDQSNHRGGGTFVVRQYVRFKIAATLGGALDIGYDHSNHVTTIGFTPDRAPAVEFSTIGSVDVDSKSVWSSVVGAVGTVFATSPETAATGLAKAQGTKQLAAMLAHGIAVTVDLCTGLIRAHLGRPPKGEMAAADVGETRRVPVEIEPEGVMIIGPQLAGDGLTLEADTVQGAVNLSLVCVKDAEAVAAAFVAGRSKPNVPVLATIDLRNHARLRLGPTACPVVVIATPLDHMAARFAWERPSSEIAKSTGGPLIHCRAKP